MYAAHVKLSEIISIIKRRKRLLIIPPILVTIICTIAAFTLPRKYEAWTTILIRKDDVLNPLVKIDMAVSMVSDDRIRSFGDIVYSTSTVQAVVDSLRLDAGMTTETERQYQLNNLKGRIGYANLNESTVRIIVEGDDPVFVQQATGIITRKAIRTMIQVENQKNEMTVRFFQEKLQEYQEKFEISRQAILPVLQERIAEMPAGQGTLVSEINQISGQRQDIEAKLEDYRRALTMLGQFPEALRTESGQRSLSSLQRYDLPFSSDLKPLITRYSDMSRRYTSNYPGMVDLESQILEMLNNMKDVLSYEIPEQTSLLADLNREHGRLVASLQQSSVVKRMDHEKESSYDIYRRLYDDMKVKLEQARTNRELRKMGEEQFVVIDPPVVPTRPTKPNRVMVIMAGMIFGMVLGAVAVVLSELFDTTINSPDDLKMYKAPVVALIPARTSENRSN